MNKKRLIFAGLCLLIAGAFMSCKGRTMKNMEPTGDTVEVQVTPLVPEAAEDTVGGMSASETAL